MPPEPQVVSLLQAGPLRRGTGDARMSQPHAPAGMQPQHRAAAGNSVSHGGMSQREGLRFGMVWFGLSRLLRVGFLLLFPPELVQRLTRTVK